MVIIGSNIFMDVMDGWLWALTSLMLNSLSVLRKEYTVTYVLCMAYVNFSVIAIDIKMTVYKMVYFVTYILPQLKKDSLRVDL